ncbi:MAG: hypothetical protein FWF46_05110 [Oscillospiraceae bacterium]|nr:hypothetical protein [Oscillospiraceae bacterium]
MKWYEYKFVIEDNIGRVINKLKRFDFMSHKYFYIIKRPFLYLRVYSHTNILNIQYNKIYEPECFQFGGEEGFEVISNYFKIAAEDIISNNRIMNINYYLSILKSIFRNIPKEIILKSLKILHELRKSDKIETINLKEITIFLYDDLYYELLNINLLFEIYKILPYVIIFIFNIYDISLVEQQMLVCKMLEETK